VRWARQREQKLLAAKIFGKQLYVIGENLLESWDDAFTSLIEWAKFEIEYLQITISRRTQNAKLGDQNFPIIQEGIERNSNGVTETRDFDADAINLGALKKIVCEGLTCAVFLWPAPIKGKKSLF